MFVASVVNPVFNRLLLFESDLDLLHISEWIIVFTYNKEDCFSSVKLCINKKKSTTMKRFTEMRQIGMRVSNGFIKSE